MMDNIYLGMNVRKSNNLHRLCSRWSWITILLLLLLVSPCQCVLAQADSTRISCFVMGQVVYAPWNPFTSLFMQDPLFQYALYPLPTSISLDEKRRLDRVYYPRTGRMLTESYEVIVFRDARVNHFSPGQFRDLEQAFREAGMVSVTVHSLSWTEAWLPTVLYDLSPISDYKFRFEGTWRASFRREREPIFLPFVDLGVDKVPGWEYGIMNVKEGATVWADMVPQGHPWLVSWRPGGSSAVLQWVFADKFDSSWWGSAQGARDSNPYAIDLATNLLLYSLDRDLIGDIHARREARHLLSTFRAQKLLILSMLDWAEKFGANILPLSCRLGEIEREAEGAVDRYLEQDYASAIAFMESMSWKVSDITTDAMRQKDQALFWVHVSEWLAVTSVLMISGVVIWSLMVRRWMYKEVRATRLRLH